MTEIEALTEDAMGIIAHINKIRRKAVYRELLPLEVHVQTIIQLLSAMYNEEWSGRERARVEEWVGERLDYVRCKPDTKSGFTAYRGVKDLDGCWEVIQPHRKRLRAFSDDENSTGSVSFSDASASSEGSASDAEEQGEDSCLSEDERGEISSAAEREFGVTINLIDDEAEEELEW